MIPALPPDDAPEFPSGLRWLGRAGAPTWKGELRGKVVVLDFWTSSCVHSRRNQETLRYLQQVYSGEPLVVIGVHVGKFARERWPAHVTTAVTELGIRHLVVLDDSMQIWRAHGCTAWPTLVLVDGVGRVRFAGAGEAERAKLAAAVGTLLRELAPGAAGSAPQVLPWESLGMDRLWHPGKCAVDAPRGLIWISDTRHHRVVAVEERTGNVVHSVGDGTAGAGDGALALASFFLPQGVHVHGQTVYVADSGNGSIRAIDVATGTVTTVLEGLATPMDLVVAKGELIVAVAGAHQLLCLDLASSAARLLAGTGGQGLLDGPALQATFARPCGLALRDDKLAVADASASAVRIVDLEKSEVRTWIGKGLFSYGDLDGPCAQALLQQPLSLAWHGEDLLIADTLNGKIKRLSPATGRIDTILGPVGLGCELAGIAVNGDTLWIADSTEHRLLRADLGQNRVEVFEVHGLTSERSSEPTSHSQAGPITICARGDATLKLELQVPLGDMVHPDAPLWAELENEPGGPLARALSCSAELEGGYARIVGVPFAEPGEGAFRLRLRYMTCRGLDQAMHHQEIRLLVRAMVVEAGPDAALL